MTIDGRLVTALVILMCVSGALGVHPGRSLNFMKDFWKIFLYYLLLRSLTVSLKTIDNLVFIIIFGTGMLGAATVAGFGGDTGRLSAGGMYDPNDLGLMIVTSIPLGLYYLLLHRKWRRWIAIVSLIASLMALGLTQSRAAFFGLCFVGLFMLINNTGFRNRFRKILLLATVGAVFVVSMPPAYIDRLGNSFDKEDTGIGRIEMWKKGLSLVPDAPIIGHGVNAYVTAYGMALGEGHFEVDPTAWKPYAWRAAHSAYVTVIVELGLVGFGIYMALFGIPILGLRKYNSERKIPYLASEHHLHIYAVMIQTSFLGFAVCAATLSVTFYPILFFLVAISGSLISIAKDFEDIDKLETSVKEPRKANLQTA